MDMMETGTREGREQKEVGVGDGVRGKSGGVHSAMCIRRQCYVRVLQLLIIASRQGE